jgi:hypothetical protein
MVTKQNQTEKNQDLESESRKKTHQKERKNLRIRKIFPAKNGVCRYLWLMAPLRFTYAGLLNKQ